MRAQMQEVFRKVFDDPALVLRDEMTAEDVEGWDSLAHINLIVAIEKQFGVKFATAEIAGLKRVGENVGSLMTLMEKKLGRTESA
jgi:acyl carrier protein